MIIIYICKYVMSIKIKCEWMEYCYMHSRWLFISQVFGVGIPNPYRLRPYLGAKVPLNSSFTPIIKIHNPFSSTLQVRPYIYTYKYVQLRQKLIDIVGYTALQ